MPASASPGSTGVRLHPFRGVRYDGRRSGALSALVCPPYDDIGCAGVQALCSRPHHISRLLHARDPRAAARRLDRWLSRGVLVREDRPALYVYQLHDGERVLQRGVIGTVELPGPGDEPGPGEGAIVPHEDVRPQVVADRAELMAGLGAQPEPLLLTYDSRSPGGSGGSGERSVARVLDRLTALPPVATAPAGAGTHTLWACTDPDVQARIAAELAAHQALIADGHHRYTASRQLYDRYGPGPTPWQRVPALLVDSATHPLEVAAIHRHVPGIEAEKAAAAAADVARVRPLPGGWRLPEAGELVLTGGGRAWAVSDPDPRERDEALAGKPPQWRDLPAAVADRLLLGRAWSADDLPGSVHHLHDAERAVGAAAAPGGGTAVLVPPLAETTVRKLAAAGVVLPSKSTSFGPKPATGLVLRVPGASGTPGAFGTS